MPAAYGSKPVTDGLGREVSDPRLIKLFRAKRKFFPVIRSLRDVKKAIQSLAETEEVGAAIGEQIISGINTLMRKLRLAQPFAACPSCDGAGCRLCADRGWTTKTQYPVIEGIVNQ